jgi:hypothetical protein
VTGRPDLVVGAPRAHVAGTRSGGAVWAVGGTRSRARIELSRPRTRAWELVRGARDSFAGAALALADVNGDRLADTAFVANGTLAVAFGTRRHTTADYRALPVPAAP